MKILNIFGLVVAVHVVVFLLIFAIPGCRSSQRQQPRMQVVGAEPDPALQSAGATPRGGTMSSADLNPPLVPANPDTITYGSAAGGASGRSSPTRPGSAPATGATAGPSVQPVEDVAPARSYTVVRGDSLWSVAKKHDLTVRELAAANNLSANATLRLDQKLIIPGGVTPPASPAAAAAASGAAADTPSYTVRPGDTLATIARRHNTTVNALRAANNLRGDLLRVGDRLVLPAAASTAALGTASSSTATPAPARVAGPGARHTVAPGETLGAIARRYDVRVGDIATANNITDPRTLRAGQELIIPGASGTAATSPTVSSSPAGATANATTAASVRASQSAQSTPAPARQPAATPPLPAPGDDLDAGLGEPADVPVIQVEEPVRTITIPPAAGDGGSGGAGDENGPPRFQ